MAKRRKHRKSKLSPDFFRKDKSRFLRNKKKTLRFNQVELEFIEDYCKKFNIHSRSAFFRDCIMGTIMKEMDENYPRLF